MEETAGLGCRTILLCGSDRDGEGISSRSSLSFVSFITLCLKVFFGYVAVVEFE